MRNGFYLHLCGVLKVIKYNKHNVTVSIPVPIGFIVKKRESASTTSPVPQLAACLVAVSMPPSCLGSPTPGRWYERIAESSS